MCFPFNKLTSVFNASVLLLIINFVITSISYRGSIVWNLLEPSALSARDYAKRAKKSHPLRNLNFNEESPQMDRPQIDSRDFVFY